MPECQKIKKGGLDQYGPERFDRLIFATIRKSVGLKELRHPTVMFTVKPFNLAALKVGDFACKIN